MKTLLQKPARTNASYSEQYKEQALELWLNSGRSAAKVAAELGIRPPLLLVGAKPGSRSDAAAIFGGWRRSDV
jgi:transposase-like protein